MQPRHLVTLIAGAAFVATIFLANWLVNHYGPIRVFPTHLYAPAGVYVVGLAFLLRDTIQRFSGQLVALALIAVGAALSALVSPKLALASAVAFAASELAGLIVFWISGGNIAGRGRLTLAVVAASVAAAAIDSYVFLTLAPTLVPGLDNVSAFWRGQFIAKISVVVLALPFVLAARKIAPTPEPAAA